MDGEGEPGSRRQQTAWLSTELGRRVVSALVLAAVTLLATYGGGWLFGLLWLGAGYVVFAEWTGITGVGRRQTLLVVGTIAFAVMVAAVEVEAFAWAGLAAALVGVTAVALLAPSARDRGWAVAGFVYAAVIVVVPPLVREHPALGIAGLLWMFAVVWITDIAAYFTGRAIGGPKLWPRVSPKKTWSGFLGGLIGAVLAGVLVVVLAESVESRSLVPLWFVALASAVGSVASQLGDLGESALKRGFAVKDSGRLIPGHGGVMDRLDGFWALCALIGLGAAGAWLTGRW